MKKIFLIAIVALISINISHAQDLLWLVETDTMGYAWPEELLIGAGNEAYVGGTGSEEMYLLQYDNHGNIEFANVEMGEGYFEAMTLGDNGNIYQVGEKKVGQQYDAVLHAFEADGTPVFTKIYDQYGKNDIFHNVSTDTYNNSFVCGSSNKTSSDVVALVAKFSPTGSPVWYHEYEIVNHHCRFKNVHLTDNGDIYAVGSYNYSSPGSMDFLVCKYDENGNLISDQSGILSGYSQCHPAFSLMDDEENIYIGGYVKNWDPPNAGFLMKISNGVVVWSHIIPYGGNSNQLIGGAFGPDGNIICYGSIYNSSDDYDAYYAQFSPGGGMLNEKIYSGPNNSNDAILDICVKDEYIYLCGTTYEPGTSFYMLAIKLNSDFEQMWELIYDFPSRDAEQALEIAVDLDNHVLLAGITVSSQTYFGVLAKFVNPLGIDDLAGTEVHPIEVFPNPATSSINFQLQTESDDARYIISNTAGQIVQSRYLSDILQQQIELSALHSGIYFLQILDGKKQYYAKFVKQ